MAKLFGGLLFIMTVMSMINYALAWSLTGSTYKAVMCLVWSACAGVSFWYLKGGRST